MLVYVSFVVALAAANFGADAESEQTLVSPGSLPAKISTEQSFFRPTIAQSRRKDI